MTRHVLLLNADYNILSINPLSTITWQNAMKLHFTGGAQIVHHYEDWEIHSPSTVMKVPSVMALSEYRNIRRGVKFTTKNLLLRDDYMCQYCGNEFPAHLLTKDHVKPRKHGGKTNWENIVAACGPCNHRRGHDESIRPKKEPHRPTIYEINNKLTSTVVVAHDETWTDFLSMHWDVDKIKLLKDF